MMTQALCHLVKYATILCTEHAAALVLVSRSEEGQTEEAEGDTRMEGVTGSSSSLCNSSKQTTNLGMEPSLIPILTPTRPTRPSRQPTSEWILRRLLSSTTSISKTDNTRQASPGVAWLASQHLLQLNNLAVSCITGDLKRLR